jgi:hypothetical protein
MSSPNGVARLFLQPLLAGGAKTCRSYFSVFGDVTAWVRLGRGVLDLIFDLYLRITSAVWTSVCV